MVSVRADLPAVVLDSHDHGETDKIVTLFCQDIGRLTTIAKGAHRSKKRFVNKLELFSFLKISYSRSAPGHLAVITGAELLNSFLSLRSNLPRYHAASVLREFILLVTSEKLNEDHLFQLALWALHALDKGADQKTVLALFLIKLYDAIGYRPDFLQCRSCDRLYQAQAPAVFSPQAGGLLCSRCRQEHDYSGRQLSPGTIQMIISVQQQPLSMLDRFRPTAVNLRETLDCLYRYGRHLYQKDIHSWKWLGTG